MEKCSCWKPLYNYLLENNNIIKTKALCYGTKEREECTCNGDVSRCDFYPEKRKENKTMNTAEMWLKAQEDGMCYEIVNQENDNNSITSLYYQKDKGLFNSNDDLYGYELWEYFDDAMNEQWQLRTMTKSEAEAKSNIKIID